MNSDWYLDPFKFAPGVQHLLTLNGADQSLGGIAGFDAKETGVENPEILAAAQRITSTYLYSALELNDSLWEVTLKVLKEQAKELGTITSK